MEICIQDPSWPESEYLLERIIESSSDATCGGAAFAFATIGGVRLLLQDESFCRFLSRSSFDLLVGVDAVTNLAALECMGSCMVRYPSLSVRVFFNDLRDSLFHPKLCWFRGPGRTVCLVGSGNLTPGGLRSNREAFTVFWLDRHQSRQFDEAWSSWLALHLERLLLPDHPDVLKRAKANRGTERPPHWSHDALIEDSGGHISVGVPRSDADAVLIAEIPKSGDRWNQANFDLETFRNYFGAIPGHTQRIILTHIDSEGKVGPEEVRPSVAVSSHNFRFELDAASGLRYPRRGRPIGVFVRVATRTFRYRLLMPGTRAHASATKYLDDNCPAPPRGLRRFVTTVGRLRRSMFFTGLAAHANQ